jgi:hypothetical protein
VHLRLRMYIINPDENNDSSKKDRCCVFQLTAGCQSVIMVGIEILRFAQNDKGKTRSDTGKARNDKGPGKISIKNALKGFRHA